VGDIDIAVVDSLKVLDPRRPIREADIRATRALRVFSPLRTHTPESLPCPVLCPGADMRRRSFLGILSDVSVWWRTGKTSGCLSWRSNWLGFHGEVEVPAS